MAKITEQLLKKRSEHNECEISTLEELSLHQEDIVKIEHLQNWCKNLKILLLQSNLIAKLENLNKLKRLEYLNLALNNIEVIENLDGCESLQKLDLTLNFIGEITSIESLKKNIHLESLYLTGNPCTDYEGYRDYVISVLGQLKMLDSVEIQRSERIKALQNCNSLRSNMLKQQNLYKEKRLKQKAQSKNKLEELEEECSHKQDSIESQNKFWSEMSENTPEARIEIACKSRRNRTLSENKVTVKKRAIKLFNKDGEPLNVNEARIVFNLTENENNSFVLELELYKFLDTQLLDLDIQPMYVKVIVKGKVFQITLREEVNTEQSTAKRSQTTGHLVITMPKIKGEIKQKKKIDIKQLEEKKTLYKCQPGTKREFLEIGPPNCDMDFSNISKMAEKQYVSRTNKYIYTRTNVEEKLPSKDFIDDPEVPSLV